METLFVLVPLSLVLLGGIVAALVWAINSGQFEDLVGPADRVAHESDFIRPASPEAPDTSEIREGAGED